MHVGIPFRDGYGCIIDTFSTRFRPLKSKAPETLGISGAWQGDLERAKGIEPSKIGLWSVPIRPIATVFDV